MSTKGNFEYTDCFEKKDDSEIYKALTNKEKFSEFRSWFEENRSELYKIKGYDKSILTLRSTKKGDLVDDDATEVFFELAELSLEEIWESAEKVVRKWDNGKPKLRSRISKNKKKRMKWMLNKLMNWRDIIFFSKMIRGGLFLKSSELVRDEFEMLYLKEGTDFYNALEKELDL